MRLHARIYLHSLAVLVIACVATAATFALSSRTAMMHEIAERVARHLATDVAEVMGEPDALARRLQRFHDELGVTLVIRDPADRVLAASGEPAPRRSWSASAPIHDDTTGAVLGVIEASTPRPFGPLHLLRPGLLVGLILAVVALVTIFTTRRISRPLERLTSAVRRLGGGELSTRVPLVGLRTRWRHRRRHDELVELTSAFNEMADRLERLVRGERELLANVSHELRSPLTRIRMALELLPPAAANDARLHGVKADLDDLERLIDDVLTAARLDATGLPARLDALDARAVLVDVAERARHDPLVDGRPIDVVAGPPIPLTADGALLRRAIWNLVENAAKYGAPPITLAAERLGDRVLLSIADDGPGIPPAERAEVFTPFYRGDRARTPHGARGVGLGLTLARRVAEVHGGSIAVDAASTVDGHERGCRVVITLPADHATA